MQYVCDALLGRTWFRIETDAEAEDETRVMRHAVEKHFRREQDRARLSYQPGPGLEEVSVLEAGHQVHRRVEQPAQTASCRPLVEAHVLYRRAHERRPVFPWNDVAIGAPDDAGRGPAIRPTVPGMLSSDTVG